MGLEYRVHSERRQRQGVTLKKLNNRVVCLISARHGTSNFKSVLFHVSTELTDKFHIFASIFPK